MSTVLSLRPSVADRQLSPGTDYPADIVFRELPGGRSPRVSCRWHGRDSGIMFYAEDPTLKVRIRMCESIEQCARVWNAMADTQ